MYRPVTLIAAVATMVFFAAATSACMPETTPTNGTASQHTESFALEQFKLDAFTVLYRFKVTPGENTVIRPVLTHPENASDAGLKTLAQWVAANATKPEANSGTARAVAAINAGYFDPNNGQSASWIELDKKTLANPTQNSRLTENRSLAPYLPQIFDRSETQTLSCNATPGHPNNVVTQRIARHSAPLPTGCVLVQALGAGPALLPDVMTAAADEAFYAPKKGRDPLGILKKNARSALAITPEGQIWFVMVQQTQPNGGLTLPELANWLRAEGALQALALDGGSSSALWTPETGIKLGLVKSDGTRPQRALHSLLVVYAQR
ncbi:MAG: phosphodiester glycosidase family protein [Vampirovibrionales bacterium]|nr:phosphodiester glycosidase family protein [Vampirovibrionales bacterium]